MPKIAYSKQQREQIRENLIVLAQELMSIQGVRHTTIEQIYQRAGISRTFFYTFFASKEDLILEIIYYQQPLLLAYAEKLVQDPSLSWEEALKRFLYTCCHGERNRIVLLTITEQQMLFQRLSPASYQQFRRKQELLWHPGAFRHRSQHTADPPVYQSVPERLAHPSGNSRHAASFDPGDGRRNHSDPDLFDRRMSETDVHGYTAVETGSISFLRCCV